jgi:hypothetical protein
MSLIAGRCFQKIFLEARLALLRKSRRKMKRRRHNLAQKR